jgi:CMP-N-acetylneuraminic acid synthetase
MHEKKIIGVILARGGSKAIPLKNLAKIDGKPLISYSIIEALQSPSLDVVLVSSDSVEILATALQYGAIPVQRPIDLSGDTAKPIECIQHAVGLYEKHINQNGKYEFVVELLATNPFKTAADIENVVSKQIKTNADSVIAVMPLEDHHPIRIKKLDGDKIRDFCLPEIPESRRQDLQPLAYIRNGSIYSMRRDMMNAGVRYGTDDSRAYIMPRERTLNIDEPMDLVIADMLMHREPRAHVKPKMDYQNALRLLEKELVR